jgi:Cu/Ag efflux protein CusF
MKKALTLAALAILTVALAARAHDDPKAHKHDGSEKVVSGTISRLDMNYRALTVTDAKAVNWQIMWNDATRIMGGELKEGAPVQLGYVEAQNRNWASWIKVQAAAK